MDDFVNEESFSKFMRYLMLAYTEGKHVVVIEPLHVKKILESNILDDYTNTCLRHYSNHNKASLSFLRLFEKVISIVSSGSLARCFSDFYTHTEYYEIRIGEFLDSSNFQRCILLGENGNDVMIYAKIADYYRTYNNLNFSLSYKSQTGGGSTTVKEYETIYNNKEEFCFCILDSDKRTPTTAIGDTAKAVRKFHNSLDSGINYKCHYHILDVLELENILPLNFYKKELESVGEKKGILKKIQKLKSIEEDSILFFDFKEGLRSFSSYVDKEDFIKYWCGLVLQSKMSCDDQVGENYCYVKGYGDSILKTFLELSDEEICNFISGDINESYWLEIGKKISSFIFGGQIIRAI